MLIKNGKIIDTIENRVYPADILIRDGKIARIITEKESSAQYADEKVIDASDCLIAPGLIDTHVHFRDPGFTYKEDIISGAEAAKAGGYTGIVLMANTNPKVDNVDTLKYVLDKGAQTGINIYTCANVSMNMEGRLLTDMPLLKSNGAVGFTDDGVPVMDSELCYAALKAAALLDVPISFHEENPNLIKNNGINRGKASAFYNIEGSPREAEIDLIKRDIDLIKRLYETEGLNPKAVIQHISTKEGVDMVREAQKSGLNIHAEATPHHFTLTEDAAIEYGTNAKMNPPLRTEEDRKAIIRGIIDGTIDLIATDHAPHAAEEKFKPITEAPSGILGLETSLSLGIKVLVNENKMPMPDLIKRMSTTPAMLYGIDGGKIENSLNADLTIFDPLAVRRVDSFKSKSSNSPFKGWEIPGVIKYTICAGNVVFKRD